MRRPASIRDGEHHRPRRARAVARHPRRATSLRRGDGGLPRAHRRVNPRLNAIVSLRDGDGCCAQAERATRARARRSRRGWLHGVPQAIKDLAPTAGIRTTNGSPLIKRQRARRDDALMVARMKAAGCIVIGKTNAPEFGLGSHTFNEVFGATHNAYDLSKRPAAAAAARRSRWRRACCRWPTAATSWASLRNPAGWNNVFGFRPSQGRVPSLAGRRRLRHAARHRGPDGAHGEGRGDAAGRAGRLRRPRAAVARRRREVRRRAWTASTRRRVRIGWLGDLDGYLAMEPASLDVCEAALRRLEGARLHGRAGDARLPAGAKSGTRGWCGDAGSSPRASRRILKNPENRDLIKPEALWEHDQGAAPHRRRRARTRASSARAFYQHDAASVRALRLPRAAERAGVAVRRRASAGRRASPAARWTPTTAGWRSMIYATFAGLPCISVPAASAPRACRWGCS